MGEVEVQESTKTEKTQVNLDVNDVISKVYDFINNVKGISEKGEPMKVCVEGFNFSFSKTNEEYELDLKINLAIKPKQAKPTP
ncbi:MAG: hypothetical protein NWF01_09550 [Candidatus Bathyarchaeota archaeon]|nr:hypothetical protein [Candidatus Bathyarchaeota archaeon]